MQGALGLQIKAKSLTEHTLDQIARVYLRFVGVNAISKGKLDAECALEYLGICGLGDKTCLDFTVCLM